MSEVQKYAHVKCRYGFSFCTVGSI